MYRFLLRWVLLGSAFLAACAGPGITPLQLGANEAEVRQLWGEPTGRYALPDGSRLEYATGPYGVTTWMVDLDATGHVTGWRQVLSESNLQAVQGQLPGMDTETLLRTLGRPGERRHGGRQGGQWWFWRFHNSFCLWFLVDIGNDGIVRESVFDIDPRCNGGEYDRRMFF